MKKQFWRGAAALFLFAMSGPVLAAGKWSCMAICAEPSTDPAMATYYVDPEYPVWVIGTGESASAAFADMKKQCNPEKSDRRDRRYPVRQSETGLLLLATLKDNCVRN